MKRVIPFCPSKQQPDEAGGIGILPLLESSQGRTVMGALQDTIQPETSWRKFKSGGLTRLTSHKGAAILPVTWGRGESKVSRDFQVGIAMPTNLEEKPISWMSLQGMRSEEIPTGAFILQDKDGKAVALVSAVQTQKENRKQGKKTGKKKAAKKKTGKKAGKEASAKRSPPTLDEADDQPSLDFVEAQLRDVLHEAEDLSLGLAQLVVIPRVSGCELAQCLQDVQDQFLARLNTLLGAKKSSPQSTAKKKASKKAPKP